MEKPPDAVDAASTRDVQPKPRPTRGDPSMKVRYCPLCDETTAEWAMGKKRFCTPCTREYESAYNEVRRQKELKEFKELADDMDILRDFLARRPSSWVLHEDLDTDAMGSL